MPSDDLILSLKQIAGYSAAPSAQPGDAIVVQRGGLGGPYLSMSAQAFVGTALAQGGDMAINGAFSANSIQGGSGQFSNLATGLFSAQKASVAEFNATAGTIGCVPIATTDYVNGLRAFSVTSFNGRVGDVRLWIHDILRAGGAPIFSPVFGGFPRAPTPQASSNSTRLATTEFVQRNSVLYIDSLLANHPFVFTFNGRTGDVVLTEADVAAAGGLANPSPQITGEPTAPTAALNTETDQIATTAFVYAVLAQATGGPFLPLAGGTLTGIVTANVVSSAAALASAQTINMNAVGSGSLGPETAQMGLMINAAKDNWVGGGAAATGEIDGLQILCRQGGQGDCGGMLLNVEGTGDGYLVMIEGYTILGDPATGAPIYQLGAGMCTVAPATGDRLGLYLTSYVGNMSSAIEVVNAAVGTTYWTNVLRNYKDGVLNFTITDDGNIVTTGTISSAAISAASLAATGAVNCASLTATGPIVATGSLTCQSLGVNTVQAPGFGMSAGANVRDFLWTSASGVEYQNSTGLTTFFNSSGVQMTLDASGNLDAAGALATGGDINGGGNIFNTGQVQAGTGYISRPGVGGVANPNLWNFNWDGSGLEGWVANVELGTVNFTSDYRTKKNVVSLGSMWDRVKALVPVSYSLKDYTPDGVKAEPFVKGDDKERWGFIAHELQAALIEDAATGAKDAKNVIQSPNPWTVLAALTRALQEAMARIETLETRMAT